MYINPIRIDILASGSSANCALLRFGDTRILIDAGLPFAEVVKGLADIAVDPGSLTAAICTHFHNDHTQGLPKLAGRLRIPVYMTEATRAGIKWGNCGPVNLSIVEEFDFFRIGEIAVSTFPVPHDAPCVGFTILADGERLTWVTDLGHITPTVDERLRLSDLIFMECNFSEAMLAVGEYHPALKARISGPLGHLSNEATCGWLRSLDHSTKRIILGHLSAKANNPTLVKVMAQQALDAAGIETVLEIV
jgi:phosphoribosyl 1,2-cyclic phosphodiesterase